MGETIQTLLTQWTGVDQFDSVETSTLEQLTVDYPFSPSVQLLLTKKYQSINSPLFERQLQKTTCFFPSTLQLHQWIHSKEIEADTAPVQKLSSLLSEQLEQFQASIEEEKLKNLNFFELSHGELPDVVAYSKEKNWLYLIEAYHSTGPMSDTRVLKLKELLTECKCELIFITAFLDKATFKKQASVIAWETEVWIAGEPDHMVHFNGDKFLGNGTTHDEGTEMY